MKLATLDKISAFLAELIGTGLITFAGCMSCVEWGGQPPSHLQVCIAFGLVIMFIIQIFGCVSGAHLNPAVTVSAFIYKMIDIKMSCVYILAQCVGAFMGFGLLKLVTPALIFRPEGKVGPGVCSTVPNPDITTFQALLVEFLATTVLILVCCGVWDPRNSQNSDSIPLRFGFTITALALVTGPYTGCSMNPARTLGPAIWNQDFDRFWIYWVGPLAAGLIITLIYRTVFWRDVPKEKPKTIEEFPLSDKNIA